MFKVIYLFLFVFALSFKLQAQEKPSETSSQGFEYGLHIGKLLPNDISGITEIIPLWGARLGHSWSRYHLEAGYMSGSDLGVEWSNAHFGLRLDLPIEQLVGFVTFGADLQRYKPLNESTSVTSGGYFGGGILSKIDPDIWFRIDMKFNVKPGTSMYFGLGIMIR